MHAVNSSNYIRDTSQMLKLIYVQLGFVLVFIIGARL